MKWQTSSRVRAGSFSTDLAHTVRIPVDLLLRITNSSSQAVGDGVSGFLNSVSPKSCELVVPEFRSNFGAPPKARAPLAGKDIRSWSFGESSSERYPVVCS